jgi:dihydroxycyclohexadiene carboxylate dehydrogenase
VLLIVAVSLAGLFVLLGGVVWLVLTPPRLTPRNEEQPSEQEKAWYQQVVDQTVASSLLHRYGTLAEQANAILFLASDEASYITGVTLPVAGGDLG